MALTTSMMTPLKKPSEHIRPASIRMLCGIFLLAVVVVMFLLDRFAPLCCDDWHYLFIFGSHDPIQSVHDIMVSQYLHYQRFNGRFVVHFLVQLFDGLFGKGVFNVFNALVFAALLWGLALVTVKEQRQHYYKVMSVALLVMFFIMPGFKDVFLWLAGSFNYLWVGTALLYFNELLERDTVPRWSYIPLTLFALACGWSNEAFVVGLGAAYLYYYILRHRELFTGHRRWMLPAFFIGAALLAFAPGSLSRAATTGRPSSLLVSLFYMRHLRLMIILAVIAIIMACVRRRSFVAWVKREQVLIIAVLVEFFFLMAIGIDAVHSRFGIELFSLVMIFRLINWNRVSNLVVTLTNLAMIPFAIYLISVSQHCYEVSQGELDQARRGNELVQTSESVPHEWLHRYVLDYSLIKVNSIKMYGFDPFLNNYFGHPVLFLPEDFCHDVAVNPERYEGEWRTFGKLPFYAMRVDVEEPDCSSAILNYSPPTQFDYLPGPLIWLCNRMLGLKNEVKEDKLLTVSVNGNYYILIPRNNPGQDFRLRSIRLE